MWRSRTPGLALLVPALGILALAAGCPRVEPPTPDSASAPATPEHGASATPERGASATAERGASATAERGAATAAEEGAPVESGLDAPVARAPHEVEEVEAETDYLDAPAGEASGSSSRPSRAAELDDPASEPDARVPPDPRVPMIDGEPIWRALTDAELPPRSEGLSGSRAAARAARELARDAPLWDPADPRIGRAVWVEGRVVLPEGTPADEPIRVRAVADRVLRSRSFVGEVDLDGRFRVAFDPRTKIGELELEAPHLWLPEPRALRLWDPLGEVARPHPGEVVLAPRLGGRVEGTVRLAPARIDSAENAGRGAASVRRADAGAVESAENAGGDAAGPRRADAAGVDSAEDDRGAAAPPGGAGGLDSGEFGLGFEGAPAGGFDALGGETEVLVERPGVRRTQSARADGSVAFDALPAGTYALEVRRPGCAVARVEAVHVRPGETTDVAVTLVPEVRLAGRVVDVAGEPVAGARVWAERASLARLDELGSTFSDARGEFALTGLGAGRLELLATRAGHGPALLELGALAAGDARAELVLALAAPPRIAGVVRLPDGRPARGATVVAHPVALTGGAVTVGGARTGAAAELARARTDSDGRFELALPEVFGAVTLVATLHLDDAGHAVGEGEPAARAFGASRTGVAPDARDVRLDLVER